MRTSFKLKKEQGNSSMSHADKRTAYNRVFNNSLNAMVVLYGCITLGDAFQIIQKWNGDKYDFDDLCDYAKIKLSNQVVHNPPNRHFLILLPSNLYKEASNDDPRQYVVMSRSLANDPAKYYRLESKQSHYPYFIPRKDGLKYFDHPLGLRSPEARKLADLIIPYWRNKKAAPSVDDIMYLVLKLLKMNLEIDPVFDIIIGLIDLPFDKLERETLFEKIIELLKECRKTSRLWELNGFTPEEIEYLTRKKIIGPESDRFPMAADLDLMSASRWNQTMEAFYSPEKEKQS